jgi:hypothetical protein
MAHNVILNPTRGDDQRRVRAVFHDICHPRWALAIEGSDATLRWYASLRVRDIEVYSPDSGRGIVWVRPFARERRKADARNTKRRLPVTHTRTATAVELPTGRWVIDPSPQARSAGR